MNEDLTQALRGSAPIDRGPFGDGRNSFFAFTDAEVEQLAEAARQDIARMEAQGVTVSTPYGRIDNRSRLMDRRARLRECEYDLERRRHEKETSR